jgi:hypothetical protein
LHVVVNSTALLSKYDFGTRTAEFYICTRCGSVRVAISEIENRQHAVVNVNTFENVDPSWIQPAPADFEGEELADRLARRKRNWIADVRITEGTPGS